MRILVTGHMGFLGARVMLAGQQRGHVMFGLDRKSEQLPSANLIPALEAAQPEAIVHCAAHACIRDNWSFRGADSVWNDNVLFLRRVLDEASTRLGDHLQSFVFCSSNAVYGPSGIIDPLSPYAASKLAGEAFVRAYAAHMGWRWNVARLAPMFGTGYHRGHLADFVQQARDTGRVKALSLSTPRAAVHVDDAAERLIEMADFQHGNGILDVVSVERWSTAQSAQAMGVTMHCLDKEHGWLGDDSFVPPCVSYTVNRNTRPIRDGVRDALTSLGWP